MTLVYDAVEHARKRREEQRQAEREAFAGLVVESLDHPAVQERLRKFITGQVADSLLRVLKSAMGKPLRQLIRNIVTERE